MVNASRQILLAYPLLTQGGEQPALLQRRKPFRTALAAIQEQGIAFRQVQHHSAHCVGIKPTKAAQPLEAIDHQVALFKRDDDDRHLLPLLRQGGQEPSFMVPLPQAQHLVASIKLVKLQVHWRSSVV